MRNLYLFITLFFLSSLAHSQQVFNKLKVNDLNLPSEASSMVLTTDGSKNVRASATVDSTELSFMDGVTSALQAQLNGKQPTITGAATTITSSNLGTGLAVVSDGSGKIGTSSTTATEIGYLSGVSSGVQAQLNSKQATITGATSTVTSSNLATSKAVVSDGSGKIAASTTTATEIGYVSGVTSAIQTQIDSKQPTITGAATTITSSNLATSKALVSDGSGKVGASSVTSTELGYLSGVTSGIQGQINTNSTNITTNTTNIASNTSSITTNDGLAVHKAGTETITGDKLFTGQLTATSTTKGNRPCPVMTDTQMLAIASPSNGDCVLNSTKKAPYYYEPVTSTWKIMGGGAGAGTRLELETDGSFEDNVTEGTCSGCTASSETGVVLVTPNNLKSLKMTFTASTGSYTVSKTTNGQFAGADMTVGAWVITDQSGCSFKSRINGADTGDSKVILGDSYWHYYELIVTGGSSSNGWKIDCTTTITGSVYVDETSVKASPRVATLSYVQNASDWVSYTPTGTWTTATTYSGKWRRNGSSMDVQVSLTLSGAPTASPLAITYPTGYSVDETKIPATSNGVNAVGNCEMFNNSISYVAIPTHQASLNRVLLRNNQGSGGANVTNTIPATFISGASISCFFSIPIQGWAATNPNYLTAPETFSTDYTPLVYAGSGTYTLSTLANAPIGTFITYTHGASTNTRTQTNSAPTQTTADMATNGILISSRGAYATASTSALPTSFAIQIGKNLKGLRIGLYKSAGKTTSGNLDSMIVSTDFYGAWAKDYNDTTGVLVIDAGTTPLGSGNLNFVFSDVSTQSTGYIVINASKNPALTGFNVGNFVTTPTVTKPIHFSAKISTAGVVSNNKGGIISSASCSGGSWTVNFGTTLASEANCSVTITGGGAFHFTPLSVGTSLTALTFLTPVSSQTYSCTDPVNVVCHGELP